MNSLKLPLSFHMWVICSQRFDSICLLFEMLSPLPISRNSRYFTSTDASGREVYTVIRSRWSPIQAHQVHADATMKMQQYGLQCKPCLRSCMFTWVAHCLQCPAIVPSLFLALKLAPWILALLYQHLCSSTSASTGQTKPGPPCIARGLRFHGDRGLFWNTWKEQGRNSYFSTDMLLCT